MKPNSAKNKGRRLQNYIVDALKKFVIEKKEREKKKYEILRENVEKILNEYITDKALKAILLERIINVIFNENIKKIELLNENDIKPAIMGEHGADIKMSAIIKEILPFSIEAKNQERLNIWQAIEQSEKNTNEKEIPVVIFKRNRSKVYIVLEFEKFLKIIQ